ncbi:MAG: DUF3187 domain-containing protein [Campylobacterota bacterium]|nr:DUF3187 domain-containing protein [Campylobacterota bacterium]
MLKTLFLMSILVLRVAAYVDEDMDGVDDSYDRCLQTPFTDLVNSDGCSVESLVSMHHYSLKTGMSYSDTDYNTLSKTDTVVSSIELDYYYKNFSLGVSTSYYANESEEYSGSGMNDSFLGVGYSLNLEKLLLNLEMSIILPTYETPYNNNNTDYSSSLSASYSFEELTLFATYGFTLVNDDDVQNIASYQNSSYISGGLGYYLSPKLYLSISYNESDSIYKNVTKINTASLYSYYSIDERLFVTVNYAYGLSESASDNYMAFKIGYYY